MLQFLRPQVLLERLRAFVDRWDSWAGDRDMEIAIRRHLSKIGYRGQGAKLQGVRLAAVKRPGWNQLYQFDALVRTQADQFGSLSLDEDDGSRVHGTVSLDTRTQAQPVVECFDHTGQRADAIAKWKERNDVA